MTAEQTLIDALRIIEVQQAGLPGYNPSQVQEAQQRIVACCQESATAADIGEFGFTVPDHWSQLLLHALLKRYGLKGYRFKGQRRSTVMVRASKRLVDDVLQPLFVAMSQRLNEYFCEVAKAVLDAAVSPGPYHLAVLPNHEHGQGQLCAECARRLGL